MLHICPRLLCPILVFALALTSSPQSHAAETGEDSAALPESTTKTQLVVSTKPFSPFAFQQDERWAGFSIDLWDAIATEMEVQYKWLGTKTVAELLQTVREPTRADVAIAAITITGERERSADFSFPFYESGLQVMVAGKTEQTGFDLIKALASPALLDVVLLMFALILVSAHLVWFFEREKNPDTFPKGYLKGIWEAFWWSAVTVTTVGYGDKVVRSRTGRVVALLWMFIGLVLISYFTATVTSVLTVQRLEGSISGPADLPGRTVATVSGSTAERYLHDNAIKTMGVKHIEDAYKALESQRVVAVVYDAPALLYYAARAGRGKVRVVGKLFGQQSYGIALPQGSPHREKVNQALLTIRESGTYAKIYEKWFGG